MQLAALKYGTVPIVRACGGLGGTVVDRDYSRAPPEQRNGYVFHRVDHLAIESAMARAIGVWHGYPQHFRHLMLNGTRLIARGHGPARITSTFTTTSGTHERHLEH